MARVVRPAVDGQGDRIRAAPRRAPSPPTHLAWHDANGSLAIRDAKSQAAQQMA